jgi:hypothetical protein
VPPHVIPQGIQVSLDKVRDIFIDLARPRDPPTRPIGSCGGGGGGGGGNGGGATPTATPTPIPTQQQVVQTVRAPIRATVPGRGAPKTTQQGPGKWLVEDDERRPPRSSASASAAGFAFWVWFWFWFSCSVTLEEWKGPVGWRGHILADVGHPDVLAVSLYRVRSVAAHPATFLEGFTV